MWQYKAPYIYMAIKHDLDQQHLEQRIHALGSMRYAFDHQVNELHAPSRHDCARFAARLAASDIT